MVHAGGACEVCGASGWWLGVPQAANHQLNGSRALQACTAAIAQWYLVSLISRRSRVQIRALHPLHVACGRCLTPGGSHLYVYSAYYAGLVKGNKTAAYL